MLDKVGDKCKALQDSLGALEAKAASDKAVADDELNSLKAALKDGLQERQEEAKLINENLSQKVEALRLKTDELSSGVNEVRTLK